MANLSSTRQRVPELGYRVRCRVLVAASRQPALLSGSVVKRGEAEAALTANAAMEQSAAGIQGPARRVEVAAGLLLRLHGLQECALRKNRSARSHQRCRARDAAGCQGNGRGSRLRNSARAGGLRSMCGKQARRVAITNRSPRKSPRARGCRWRLRRFIATSCFYRRGNLRTCPCPTVFCRRGGWRAQGARPGIAAARHAAAGRAHVRQEVLATSGRGA